ncbi:MAG: hypothetical protein AABY40_02425 [Nanoarchaeota archaeon]
MNKRLPLVDRLTENDAGLYIADNMNPPPAEKKDNVIQFEITSGCSWNACTYCSMYKGTKYQEKSLPEFKEHVDKVWAAVTEREGNRVKGLERIFIGGGNALCADVEVLNEAIRYSVQSFRGNVGRLPKRVALYGNTRDIKNKVNDLRFLNCGGISGNCSIDRFGTKIGLGVLYWGMESGSTKVLQFANTGYSKEDIASTIDQLVYSGIRVSAMIMPGLGGMRFWKSHVKDTADVLNRLLPEWVTFIGLKTSPDDIYSRRMANEHGHNRNLTPEEISLQTAEMIERLDFTTTIGIHGEDVHTFGSNLVTFGAVKINGHYNAHNLASRIRQKVKDLEPQ